MQIVILLYKGFTALDVIGAYEILCRLPATEIKFAAKQKGIIESEYEAMKMVAGYGLDEIEQADILLIPGSTFAFMQVAKDTGILEQIRRIDRTTRWTTSVCSGAVILGAAGLLKGKQATTHWAVMDKLSAFGASPVSGRYVQDGKIITAAGVSAGIDMALFLTKCITDQEHSEMVQLVTEYYPKPSTGIMHLTSVSDGIKEKARAFLKSEIMKMSGFGVLPDS